MARNTTVLLSYTACDSAEATDAGDDDDFTRRRDSVSLLLPVTIPYVSSVSK